MRIGKNITDDLHILFRKVRNRSNSQSRSVRKTNSARRSKRSRRRSLATWLRSLQPHTFVIHCILILILIVVLSFASPKSTLSDRLWTQERLKLERAEERQRKRDQKNKQNLARRIKRVYMDLHYHRRNGVIWVWNMERCGVEVDLVLFHWRWAQSSLLSLQNVEAVMKRMINIIVDKHGEGEPKVNLFNSRFRRGSERHFCSLWSGWEEYEHSLGTGLGIRVPRGPSRSQRSLEQRSGALWRLKLNGIYKSYWFVRQD